jgi:hypothetical protein
MNELVSCLLLIPSLYCLRLVMVFIPEKCVCMQVLYGTFSQ